MQINELMSDSIEISYHFDELSNAIDSAMHGTSLIYTPVRVPVLVRRYRYLLPAWCIESDVPRFGRADAPTPDSTLRRVQWHGPHSALVGRFEIER
eukprot:COSAG02_NODE_686_length_18484_cov_29.523851_1_plen_96_part_00